MYVFLLGLRKFGRLVSSFSNKLTEEDKNAELIRSMVDHMVFERFPHELKTAIGF